MNLIFVEETDHIEAALGALAEGPGKIIAFSPNAVYALERRGVKFNMPEDYYDNGILQKEWVKYFDLSKKIMSETDDLLRDKTASFSGRVDIRPLFFNAQMFLSIFRQIVIDIFILDNIFGKEKPGKVFFPRNPEDKLTYRLSYERESVISHLVPLFAKDRFEARDYEWRGRHKTEDPARPSGGSWRKFLKGIAARIPEAFLPKPGGPGLMVFYGGYDLGYVLPLLRRNGYNIYYFERFLECHQREKAPHAGYYELCFGKDGADLERHFEYRGINFFPAVKSRIEFYLNHILPEYLSMHDDMKEMLEKNRIRLLIGSHSPSRIYENILCAAARELGIKTVSFQHGGYGERFNHVLHVNDFDNPMNNYFFAWGIGVEDYARKYGLNKVKVVLTGSAWADGLASRKVLRRPKSGGRKTILYLPTALRVRPKDRMLPGEFAANTYFLLQKRIISELAKNENIELLIRLHSNDDGVNPIADFIKESGFRNLRVVKTDLSELLPKVDLVISDFMSTTLIHLLAMKKNVMFYVDRSAMLLEPEARSALDKAMYCFDRLEDFLRAVSEYASFPEKFPVKDNKEFMIRYGRHLNDGRGAERAVECIKKVLTGVL